MPPGKWEHKKSLVFIALLLFNGVLAAFLLPVADAFLQRFDLHFDAHRVFSRIYLLLVLLSFAFFSSFLNLKQDILSSVRSVSKGRSLFIGAVVGCLFILLITAGAVFTEIRIIRKDIVWSSLSAGFITALVSGILIGFIETLVVWGILFQNARRDFGNRAAVVSVSVLFMLAHFIRAPEIAGTAGGPAAGMKILAGAFGNLSEIFPQIYSAAGLMIFGLFSSILFMRTGNFYLLSGIHAGAVFLIKFNRDILVFHKKDWEWLFGTSTGIDSVAGWVLLGVMLILVSRKRFQETPFFRSLTQ